MSKTLSEESVRFQQRFLKSGGFYKDTIDGDWGPNTDMAYDAFITETEKLKATLGSFDKRSENNISTLQIPAQRLARIFLQILKDAGIDARIISGTRTYPEQDQLYAIGRTIPKNRGKVTNAKGGQSNHNFGIAWDTGVFKDQQYLKTSKPYEDAAALVKAEAKTLTELENLEWGGDWDSFKDTPHYQLSTGKTTKQVRSLFEDGKQYW